MVKKQQKITDKLVKKAADGKIAGRDVRKMTSMYGREAVANALAPLALGNSNLAIGKNATRETGLKISTDSSGGRFATYTPEMVTPLRNPNSSVSSPYRATADFGKANTSWTATAGGKYRFGGAPSAPMAPAPAEVDTTFTPPTFDSYNPTPLVDGSGSNLSGATAADPASSPAMQFMPGGMGSSVDGGATGFRRKKSSARAAGLTTKGSGRLRINKGSSGATGLNIGM